MLFATVTLSIWVPIGVIAVLLVFLMVFEATRTNPDALKWEEVTKLKTQLNAEVNQAFDLVAAHTGAGHEQLRNLVIQASQRLILEYRSVLARRIVGASDYRARYEEGLAITRTIRQQLGA